MVEEDDIRSFTVPPDGIGTRLDAWLAAECEGFSRSRVQGLIRAGRMRVNGSVVDRAAFKVNPGDMVTLAVPPPVPAEPQPEDIPLDVMYEDDHMIVIDKPAGLVVHPAPGHLSGTLVNALLHHCPALEGIGGVARPGIVHRLDMDTTGVLVVAKTEKALNDLAAQFQSHTTSKRYLALVHGRPARRSGTIRGAIGRHPRDRKKMCFDPPAGGKDAVTHWSVARQFDTLALLDIRIETGRTHQIRVHMSQLGHPIFNDERYGGSEIRKGTIYAKYRQFIRNCFEICPRQALHARTLGFAHPRTGQWMQFGSELPEDMAALLDKWRKYCGQMPEE